VAAEGPREPPGLGEAGRALWTAHAGWSHDGATVDLRPDELAILATAARVADQVALLEAELAGAAMTVEGSKGQAVVNPLVPELRHQRALLATLLGRLDLPEVDGPGAWDNLTASQRARKAARARWA
jgi:hypothetical protein